MLHSQIISVHACRHTEGTKNTTLRASLHSRTDEEGMCSGGSSRENVGSYRSTVCSLSASGESLSVVSNIND